jgi:sulfite reductase alpha subunit-like flavoprotein
MVKREIPGNVILVFGCRNTTSHFLFRDEFEGILQPPQESTPDLFRHVPTETSTAPHKPIKTMFVTFSRDEELPAAHVQDAIRENVGYLA